MLRKLLRVLGIVLAAAIVIGAALLLYLEPYVTYDRDGAHLSLKKNAQDPDGTGATAALPEVSDAQIVYDEAQPGSDRITDLGGVYVTTQMLRDPEAVRAALEQQGACAVLLQLKSTFGNFYYSSSIDGAELADVDTAAVDSLIDWLSQHGYYLIAEVPAFCDTAFALANSAAALPLSSGALWMDSNGCYWLDPASETVMIYLKQIARELSSRGFREVVFSEFRFPASNSISYHSEKSGAELTQDAAQELTTFFSGSNLMISFETERHGLPGRCLHRPPVYPRCGRLEDRKIRAGLWQRGKSDGARVPGQLEGHALRRARRAAAAAEFLRRDENAKNRPGDHRPAGAAGRHGAL